MFFRMASPKYPWLELVQAIRDLRPAVRMKWSGDDVPSRWEPWVIVPIEGILETGNMGPVPFSEVEWVEIDSRLKNDRGSLVAADQIDDLIRALDGASIGYEVTEGVFRVTTNRG